MFKGDNGKVGFSGMVFLILLGVVIAIAVLGMPDFISGDGGPSAWLDAFMEGYVEGRND
jgi:hypothetical protein